MSGQSTITIDPTPAPDDIATIRNGLSDYNLRYTSDDGYQPLAIFIRDSTNTVVGGLIGDIYWEWLHISFFWLAEPIRHHGYGSQLLATAEAEAARYNCHAIHLDTMSFQALPFYQLHGYTVFGVLPDYPHGHQRYFLCKPLTPAQT